MALTKMKPLNIRFNDGTKSKIKSISEETGLSESVVARAALNRGLSRLTSIIELESTKECVDVVLTYEPFYNA